MQGEIFEKYFSDGLNVEVPRLHVGVTLHPVEEVFLDDLVTQPQYTDLFKNRTQRLALESSVNTFNRGKAHPALRDEIVRLAIELIVGTVRVGEACLVFIGGMADIDEMYEALQTAFDALEMAAGGMKVPCDILVCHSLLPLDETLKVMQPNPDAVRVILATAMAESSVTLPAVTYVIDFGFHKRIEYEQREHRTVLKPTWISKASAQQRKGRTG